MLQNLLEEPLMCEAFEENGQKGYKVTGKGSHLRLLPSQLATPCVVSPTGHVNGGTSLSFPIHIEAFAV